MTPVILLDDLQKFIEENTADILLEVKVRTGTATEKVATTAEITHIIQANEEDETTSPENPGQDDNQNNNGNEVENNDIAKGNRTITGVAWYDENANGQKEQGEKLLSNVKVRLLNTQTNHFVKEENGEILEAITNEN